MTALLAPGNPSGGNWQGRCSDAAKAAGYDWSPPFLAKTLGNMVARHGFALVERAFCWWIRNAARLESSHKWITPQAFAQKVGYWIVMSRPVDG